MKSIIKFILIGIAVALASYILPGVSVDSFLTAILAGALISVLNVTIKPILKILTFPITLVTLGLFSLVINALMILITDAVLPGFAVQNFLWALLFSIVLSIIASVFDMLDGQD